MKRPGQLLNKPYNAIYLEDACYLTCPVQFTSLIDTEAGSMRTRIIWFIRTTTNLDAAGSFNGTRDMCFWYETCD